MRKSILTVIALLPLICFSQIKKKPVLKNEIEKIKTEGLKWFKSVYVEAHFKDPYSYKLLKCDVYPQTNKEAVEKIISDAKREFIYSDSSSTLSDYNEKKREYYKTLSDFKFYPKLVTQKDVDRAKQKLDIEIGKHIESEAKIKNAQELLNKLDPIMAKKIAHYVLYIDCYSNNSYGNKVLGRFGLYYGKDGPIGDPFQLNNE
jgi:hypothetical protein